MKEIVYSQIGDFQMPQLKQEPILNSKYARMRINYLKENHPGHLFSLKANSQLNQHLLEVEKQATQMMETLMKQLLKKYPSPDKAKNQMEWVQHMNSLKQMAEETILEEIIYN